MDWGYPYYLSASDLPYLGNSDTLPFVSPMTCLEGHFAWPKPPGDDYSALGESIIRSDKSSWSLVALLTPVPPATLTPA